ncbi:MAG: hypothetical protein R3B96_12080 [Pirellulaceae bacterium]|nr:hypothetical protein [Planctomycetales bacterium]
MSERFRRPWNSNRVGLVSGLVLATLVLAWLPSVAWSQDAVRVAVWDIDASPNVGAPLAYDPCDGVELPLTCRGVVLLSESAPIVVCAVDWIGIGNGGHQYFREQLAEAAGTTVDRVAVHTLHQHDAPVADLSASALLAEQGIAEKVYDTPWFRDVVERAANAIRAALPEAQVATHYAHAAGRVEKVASNRRILGPDGKVLYTRWTATRDADIRAMPVGVIDPDLKLLCFYQNDRPIVALTFYATHPQSYYRTHLANPDFPGMARNQRQAATETLHIHFNGAGGNITAGKWNDGEPANRQVLADRVADGMRLAWEALVPRPLSAEDIGWTSRSFTMPVSPSLNEAELDAILKDAAATPAARGMAAVDLIWLRRARAEEPSDIGCLRVGDSRWLFMPGELFVEYQLVAQRMRPDLFVGMAAYGDYGPGYIGTAIAYSQGGYETSPRVSRVGEGTESVLLDALRQLLDAEDSTVTATDLSVAEPK